MNAGQATIEWLYKDQLQVDDEWAVRTPHGFRWWADKHAQTVEVVGQDFDDELGQAGYLVAVRTELLRGVEASEDNLRMLNEAFLQTASLSGPVYDAGTGTLTLCSLAWTTDDISRWMERELSMAAALQLGEAFFVAPALAGMLGAELAVSGHPQNGVRPEPDELVVVVPQLVIPQGRETARWTAEEFRDAFGEDAGEDFACPQYLDGNALVFNYALGDREVTCHLRGDVAHPGYGHGLLFLQSFGDLPGSEADGVRLALALNELELVTEPRGYGFGSYCWRDGQLFFSAFFPNAMHDAVSLRNLFMSCVARAKAMGGSIERLARGGGGG